MCKKAKRPLWPEGKPRKNEEFKPRDPKDDDLEDLIASMNNGMPGAQQMSMMRPSEMDLGDGQIDEIDVLKDEM